MKHFYTYLVEVESLIIELDSLGLTDEQKNHLAHLIDSSLHHTILDAILSQLPQEDKKVFMEYLSEGNHEKIRKFLDERIDGVEDKIKKAAQDLKLQLHKDLKEVKRNK